MRWLLGGLALGGVVLGLIVGAYAIGYGRGETKGKRSRAAAATPAATTAPARIDGSALFHDDGCFGCHSLDGSAGVGPSMKGLAGSAVKLEAGKTVAADDAYLAESITKPDAAIVKGYQAGIMPAAVAPLHLSAADVAALVAFLKTQR